MQEKGIGEVMRNAKIGRAKRNTGVKQKGIFRIKFSYTKISGLGRKLLILKLLERFRKSDC